MDPNFLLVGIFTLLGLLVGSFSNVLIWRLPRGENVSFPPSHCPKCDHPLAPRDLVPVFSWLSLGGKCRYCRAPINPRYPAVEITTGIFYGLISAFSIYSLGLEPLAIVGFCLMFTILFAGSIIDIETYTLPDQLTLVGLLIALGLAATNHGSISFERAFFGALFGAGALSVINQYGSWVMRRFQERKYPDFPIGYPQISLGLLIGSLFGPFFAAIAGITSMFANKRAKRPLPLPEILTLGGFFVISISQLIRYVTGDYDMRLDLEMPLVDGVRGAGIVSLITGFYWWLTPRRPEEPSDTPAPYDPIAMGFGDVKLMAMVGAFMGGQPAVFSIVFAVFLGAIFGLILMTVGRGNKIPFGPYLAAGSLLTFFFEKQIVALLFPSSLDLL